LIKEDFQTLERPTNANSGHAESGYCIEDTALVTNSAEIIFINKTLLNIKYKNLQVNLT